MALFLTALGAAGAAPAPNLAPAAGDPVGALRELLREDGGVMPIVSGATWEGDVATLMAVIPKGSDVDKYLTEASKRFDWKVWKEQQASQFKVRVGQQKQKKAK